MFPYNTKQFKPEELLPPDILKRKGDRGVYILNPLVLLTLQQLRNLFGRIIANQPPRLTQRTIRTLDFFISEYGSEAGPKKYAENDSMHKYNGAMDITFLDAKLEDVLKYIEEHPDEFPFIHFIEVDITWFHFDVRNQPNITFWSPKRGTVKVVKQKPIDWSLIAPHL